MCVIRNNIFSSSREGPEDPEILPWLEKHHCEVDWVKQPSIFNHICEESGDGLGEFIYEQQPDLLEFKNCQSKNVLRDWFVKRVHEIDQRSKQISNCCILVGVGIKRGLDKLTELQSNLETLKTLTYDINVDSHLSLEEFLTLTHLSKLKLLMSKSTEETFVHDYKRFLLPYLKKRSPNSKQKLQHQFIVDIAKSDLTCCLRLFEKCTPDVS